MRRVLGAILVAGVLATASAPARAQMIVGDVRGSSSATYYGAPGHYGVSYGVPSYGFPRTYTEFSSPYGPGYGYGYAPATILPGPYGAGIWRPGFAVPGYIYGSPYYGTFAVPYRRAYVVPSVPLGYYATGFGPPAWDTW